MLTVSAIRLAQACGERASSRRVCRVRARFPQNSSSEISWSVKRPAGAPISDAHIPGWNAQPYVHLAGKDLKILKLRHRTDDLEGRSAGSGGEQDIGTAVGQNAMRRSRTFGMPHKPDTLDGIRQPGRRSEFVVRRHRVRLHRKYSLSQSGAGSKRSANRASLLEFHHEPSELLCMRIW